MTPSAIISDAVAARAVPAALRGVSRSFGQVRALQDFTLELAPGEMVALLGPSGCGKTTALRVLAGLEDADAGELLLDGREISHVPAHRRDMAMVFQAYSLLPHLTVAQNIEFPLKLKRVDAAARRRAVEAHLELVGLPHIADRYAHQLSGGQQQRVALARALAAQPKVLLLDEPLSALDAKVREQLRDEIRRIQKEVGITTVFVTHGQDEALAVADRVAVMHEGRIQQLGAPKDIYLRPANAFVADFIGESNRLRGRAVDGVARLLGAEIPLLPGSAEGDVEVLVRPQHVRLEPIGAGDPADGAAVVIATSFLGAHVRVQARLEDGGLLVAQMPLRDAAALGDGQRARVTIDPAPALAVARA